MKIMILGGKGQLGSDCTNVLNETHDVMSVDLEELDITDISQVEAVAGNFGADVIVNCAAFTRVDDCESEKDLACKVNIEGPSNLAVAAKKQGAQLIHISTDYVFDGRKKVPEPYTEQDETNPISYYGVTKLEAEAAVRRATDNHMILRTAWMYGIRGQNFLKTMLRLALNDPKREIKVVSDQFGSPTWSYRLARQIAKLIESGGQGTYHATSEGYGTWYELATDFLDKMGVPHAFAPCMTKEYPTPATRPMNSILENQRLKEAGLNLMEDWQSDLAEFVLRFRDRLINEASEGLK
ncbi:MAG: dTDP-4-dehydrorhamnose reductase [Desulfobacteraceae bacterium]|nr:dTDP-4-dehydrorhamnose reductase [Desulfobacteraceae bacterium]